MAVRQEAPLQRGPVIKLPEVKRRPSRTSKIIGPLILSGAVALSAFGVYELTQNNNQKPEQTPIVGGIGEPTPTASPEISLTPSPEVPPSPEVSPSPTMESSPEITPKPDITFPGDLKSYVNGQIYGKDFFVANGSSSTHLKLNVTYEELQTVKQPGVEFQAAQLQGYELGSEIIDGHLINYFGFKDGKGGQFFFGVNYGRVNSNDQNWLDYPRTTEALTNGQIGRLGSVEETKKILDENIGNEILFSISSYSELPPVIKARSRDEAVAQSPIALKILNWCLKTKSGSYKDVPMDSDLRSIINQRITNFNAALLPEADSLIPFKKT